MARDADEGKETGFRKLIRETKEEAFHARRKLRRELPNPTGATKRQTAASLSDYRDVLWDYHSETALDVAWEERDVDVDAVDAFLSKTVTVEESLNRRGHARTQREVPLAEQVSAQHLIAIGKELDAIAKELGFAASTRDPTPEDEADLGDLRGLLKARGQTEAMRNLPGSDPDDGDGGVGVDS